jgi:hypothetical protein
MKTKSTRLELLDRLDRRAEVSVILEPCGLRSKYRCATSAFSADLERVDVTVSAAQPPLQASSSR